MTIIHPLLASRSAPNYRQSWRLAGVWRRAINLMTESGELLTLHRQGSGFGPGGWVLRRAQFDALCGGLCGNERPQVVAQGIRLGRFTVKQPQRYCLLRITPPSHPQPLAAAWMQRAEETGLFGPLALAASDPLPAELRQFRHCFQAALNGVKTDWRHWLGKGPGLTPSHDDTLSGMLLAAWYWLLTAAWLYRSAVNAGMNKSLWMILGLVGNLLAVAVFLIVRDAPQRKKAVV